jgi:hypothetical protein
LHVRGNWSTRDDRVPSAVWLGIIWVGMIAGFGLDIPGFRHQQPPAPKVIYVHAFVFTMWLVILTAQVLLVLGDRVAWHKRLGWFAAGWAVLMAIFGPLAALDVAAMHLPHPHPFLSVQLTGIPTFLALLAWGFMLRRNPAAHRRMMILATVAIAGPGFERLSSHLLHLLPDTALSFFCLVDYGSVLLIVLITAWDWWRGRLMRSFVIGAAALLTVEYLACVVYFWRPWSAFTVSLVRAWVKL